MESLEKTSNNFHPKFFKSYFESTENLAHDSVVSDCIVWHVGTTWKACIDTSYSGELSRATVLTSYKEKHNPGLFYDKVPFTFNSSKDGSSLSLYTCNEDHGNSVTQVLAANFLNEPDKNGLAPGAQIIFFNRNSSIPLLKQTVS